MDGALIAVDKLAKRQLGLINSAQLAALGVGKDRAHHLVTRGGLVPVRTRVFRLAGAPESWEQCVLAAILAAPGSAASHSSAARLHQLRGIDADGIELTAPRRLQLGGVRAHERDIPRADLGMKGPIPITTVARTLVDMAGLTPVSVLGRALDDALRREIVTVAAADRAVARARERCGDRGRGLASIRTLAALLDQRRDGPALGDSPLETKLLGWLRAAGLPDPVPQHRVRVGSRAYRVDAAYPDLRIAIEADGWDEHGRRSAFEADKTRDNALTVKGWLMLHFGDRHTAAEVVRTIREARETQTARLGRAAGTDRRNTA